MPGETGRDAAQEDFRCTPAPAADCYDVVAFAFNVATEGIGRLPLKEDGLSRHRRDGFRRGLKSGSGPLLLVYPGGCLLVAVFQHGRQREAAKTRPDQADYTIESGKRLGRASRLELREASRIYWKHRGRLGERAA